jgi:hypothetical protein
VTCVHTFPGSVRVTMDKKAQTAPLCVSLGAGTGEMLGRKGEHGGDGDLDQGVVALTAPTLLIFADADGVRLEHSVEFFKLLGGDYCPRAFLHARQELLLSEVDEIYGGRPVPIRGPKNTLAVRAWVSSERANRRMRLDMQAVTCI